MIDLPPPSLRLDFDSAALADNWRTLDRMSGAASAGAAVKADAYGIGVARAVPALSAAGARDFYVAHWSEVPALAALVPPEQVAVLHGPMTGADCAFARVCGVRPVLNSLDQAARWKAGGGGPCDLMVDTGINRLGVPMDALGDPVLAGLEIDTLMSHLASADEDSALNDRQLARFAQACAAIPARRRSLANSAGIALGADFAFDVTRPGLALYGGVPRAEFAGAIRQVVHPKAAIMQVRRIAGGEGVGYNATFIAPSAMRVGVVSLGYADGFLRARGPNHALMHEGARLPLLGKVSMDMVVVDLAASPSLGEGDWVDVPFDLPAEADRSGLSQYELLTTLGMRLRA
ncbi:Alanine racemase, biosynthetic [Tsuneonella dongtanensis]|uniref:alanine racemase n=1 Tax=Tsuneonella dongtanensis TaxID=692370 RepID=A0A1B2AFC0_9SPHN|nr:alanine racemase [Tsuneonella dongtanensis]ANY20852.1 Alanine racemase, biosynthetic [Tsuneonella dongtanensis]